MKRQGKDALSRSSWDTLEALVVLLRPFAEYSGLLQAEKVPTLASAIPSILVLRRHLDSTSQSDEIPLAVTQAASMVYLFLAQHRS